MIGEPYLDVSCCIPVVRDDHVDASGWSGAWWAWPAVMLVVCDVVNCEEPPVGAWLWSGADVEATDGDEEVWSLPVGVSLVALDVEALVSATDTGGGLIESAPGWFGLPWGVALSDTGLACSCE